MMDSFCSIKNVCNFMKLNTCKCDVNRADMTIDFFELAEN